ncbi:MAG TPA: cytochrome c peroxidase [Rhodocyclaceae bacterium]
MNFGILDLLGIGAIAVLFAGIVLMPMVQFELGPSGRLAGRGRWLLTVALGMGVLAFLFKLSVIVAVSALPQVVIAPLISGTNALVSAEPATPRLDPFAIVSVPPRYVWEALPERAPAPAGNPITPEKVALGERLFHDKALSRDRTLACASCHDVATGGVDHRATSLGIDGQVGSRNAPTVWNAAFQNVLFWDGRAPSLEEQAKGPPVNSSEMGMPSLQAVARRVAADTSYRPDFDRAFGAGSPIDIEAIAAAIATYERTLITPDSPYDRFVRGDAKAMSPAALRGMALFESLGCVVCHSGPNFSGASLFDTAAPLRLFPGNPSAFDSRYGFIRDVGLAAPGSSRGVWRVPSLRNVALTGPYFHNGSVNDLAEAVRVMASAQLGRLMREDPRSGRFVVWSAPDRMLSSIDRSALTDPQVDDIVAFLKSLTGDRLAQAARR